MTRYTGVRLKDQISVEKLFTVHYFEYPKNFSFPGEAHDFWEFVYVDKGEMDAQAGDEHYHLKQGEAIFHKPDEFHKHSANHRVAPNVFILSFVCNSSQMQFFENKILYIPEKLRPLISSILAESRNTFEMPFNEVELKQMKFKDDGIIGGQQMIRTYLEQFLILLLRSGKQNYEPVYSADENLESRMAEKIADTIEKSLYGNKITVTDICTAHGYSKAYLSRIFKDNMGCTMTEYMSKVKINEAKRLIREKGMNFTQISDALSFSNPLYFSRVFRRVTGMSPSEYRKSVNLSV